MSRSVDLPYSLADVARALRTRALSPVEVAEAVLGEIEADETNAFITVTSERAMEDARERYRFGIRSRGDAELVMAALYLPGTRPWRVERTVDYLCERLQRQGVVEVAIPMRRIVAIK